MSVVNEPKYKNDLLQAIREQLEHRALWMYLCCTDDNLDIDFHYCPLVKVWQKQECSDEEIQLLCDHAMCGDRGIAESFRCKLELPKNIAKGNGVCQIRFVRK